MKLDELKIRINNTRERLNAFADILENILGVNEFVFVTPEDRKTRKEKENIASENMGNLIFCDNRKSYKRLTRKRLWGDQWGLLILLRNNGKSTR